MTLFARIDDGIVVETFRHPVDPTPLFDPAWVWIECPDDTRPNATYDAVVGTFVNPPVPEPAPAAPPAYRKQLTPSEFRNAFSAFEEVAITAFASGTDPADTPETAMLRKVVGVFFDRLKDPHLTTVNLDDPRNLAGLDILVGQAILTVARRDEIAAGLPA